MKQWLVRRGLLAVLPVAAVAFTFGACSSSESGSSAGSTPPSKAEAPQTRPEELAPTAVARGHLSRVAQFTRIVKVAKKDQNGVPTSGQALAKSVGTSALTPTAHQAPLQEFETQLQPVVTPGDAEHFVKQNDRVRAQVSDKLKHEAVRPATVDLPQTAEGFVRIQADSAKAGVEFAIKGGRAGVALEAADGLANFPGAAPGGGDLVLRIGKETVEDFVVLEAKPEHAFVDYRVKVGEIAGVRFYDDTVEFLSASGNPEVRVSPPYLVDSDGVTHHAKLELPDCAFDTSPAAPWDRPVTAPGASECTLRVSWDDAKVTYPAIVDPVWTAAGTLAKARYRNAAATLSNGKVITCGGLDTNSDPLDSCELYSPGTNTWAAGPKMTSARNIFTLIPLGTDVLAVGDSSNATSELCNCTAAVPSWVATATNFSGGALYLGSIEPTLTADGAYVVIVDQNGKPFKYQVSAKTWTVGTQNGVYRGGYSVAAVPNGTAVMRCAGNDNAYVGLKTCEKYTPSTDTWVMPGAAGAIGNTNAARSLAAWAKIDATHVMLYGGQNATSGASIASAEIYNSGTNTWLDIGAIPNGFSEYELHNTWALLGSPGKIVSVSYYYLTVYDPVGVTWTQIQNNYEGGNYFSLMQSGEGGIAAAGSKVLVVPVIPNGGGNTAQSACKLFDFVGQGGVCGQTSECKPGLFCVYDDKYYVDGQSVCCDTACTDECSTCRSANKETKTLEGTCGPRDHLQSAAYTKCPSEAQSTCGNVGGYCDGKGACAKYDTSVACVNTSCVDGDTQNNTQYCDGKGKCGAASTTDCTNGYACVSSFGYNSCVNYCNDDSYCQSNYFCQFWFPNYNTCQPKKADGQSCTDGYSNAECKNGHCVDGVCCDTGCTETCKSCLNSESGQATGTCSFIPATSAAPKDCYDQGSASCATNGKCNGAGACQLYTSGTQCADVASCASETSRNIPDTCNGTGTCTDNKTAACTAGYSCQAGVCNTQCTSDANCASAFYCDIPNKACVPDKVQGQACLRDAACQGNANCVEIDAVSKLGVCCNSGCAGDCQSCLTVNTGVGDGTCGNVLDDHDPKNKCAQGAAYPNSCAAPGLCDGQGACRPYAKPTVECDTDVCTDSTLTTYHCNGAGTCKAKSTQCYPFKCDTVNNVCRVACTAKSDCVDGSFCGPNGTCVGQLANGSACTDGTQCGTGFCANIHEGVLQGDIAVGPGGGGSGGGGSGGGGSGGGGAGGGGAGGGGAGGGGAGGTAGAPATDLPGVCCDQACQGTCSGCKASIKGFGSDGVCEFVKNNTDPANDCEKSTTDACGLDGQCNGAGACRLAPSGTSCGASSCQGNSVLGQSCDGAGDCINNQGGVDCAPYVCRDVMGAFQCTNPCAEDNDCQDGYYCSDSACKKKLSNSKACDSGVICGSGYCVDGVCCDTSCNGQCEACDAAGSEGTCSPVKGDPHGMRAACDHAGEECGGQCDGVNASSCKYAATGTTCGTTTCDNALAKSSTCDGQGECRANKDTECSPYNCGSDDTCLSRCNTSDDCTQGYACDATSQRCLPSAVAATCSDDRLTSKGQNGNDTPCKPFLCVPASGTCAVSCAFTTDCAPDFVCEPSTKTCLPAPTGTGDDTSGSCACKAAGGGPTRSSYLALAALGVAVTGLRRRRRSRRASRPAGKPLGYASNSHPHE